MPDTRVNIRTNLTALSLQSPDLSPDPGTESNHPPQVYSTSAAINFPDRIDPGNLFADRPGHREKDPLPGKPRPTSRLPRPMGGGNFTKENIAVPPRFTALMESPQ